MSRRQIEVFLSRSIQVFTEPRLLLLSFSFLIVRFLYIFDGVIPFSFDHGKDMIATLEMVTTFSPKLTGPWTSIPGLHFGPFWYYLLAPFSVVGGWHPVAPVYGLAFLMFIQMVLAYRYLGTFEALMITFGGAWVMFSSSAWNPFPMTLISLLIIIVLKHTGKKAPTRAGMLSLGALVGFGFSFSAAFTIFYPIILGAYWVLRKIKPAFSSVVWAFLGLVSVLLPQIAFEVKHNFIQTKAVLQYFSQPEDHALTGQKVVSVIQTVLGEAKTAVVPSVPQLWQPVNTMIGVFIGLILILAFVAFWSKKPSNGGSNVLVEYSSALSLTLCFLTIPTIGYFFLHFNVWYLYGMLPPVVWLMGCSLRMLPSWYHRFYLVLLAFGAGAQLLFFRQENITQLREQRSFLPLKLQTLEVIRKQAENRAFASYHYVPEVYDYTYQYLYFWQAIQGKELPTEFSYKPNETAYIPEKGALLAKFQSNQQAEPEVIFFVVEQPENEQFLAEWWGQQQYGDILNTTVINSAVTVFMATPAN